jgi:vacuolar-type H+-ATPase subunit B/Vma2
MKILKISVLALLGVMSISSVAMADTAKGQKLYSKKLKKACGMSGAKMAALHSQDEWIEINDEDKLGEEILSICPDVKEKALKPKYIVHYYDFFYEYANDSGNVPSC